MMDYIIRKIFLDALTFYNPYPDLDTDVLLDRARGLLHASARDIWKANLLRLAKWHWWRWRCPSLLPLLPNITAILSHSWHFSSAVQSYEPFPDNGHYNHPFLAKYRIDPLQPP